MPSASASECWSCQLWAAKIIYTVEGAANAASNLYYCWWWCALNFNSHWYCLQLSRESRHQSTSYGECDHAGLSSRIYYESICSEICWTNLQVTSYLLIDSSLKSANYHFLKLHWTTFWYYLHFPSYASDKQMAAVKFACSTVWSCYWSLHHRTLHMAMTLHWLLSSILSYAF